MTIAARKAALESTLTKVAGAPVEITIRGDREFTFSTEIVHQDLEFALFNYFAGAMQISAPTEIDNECGTFVYMRAA